MIGALARNKEDSRFVGYTPGEDGLKAGDVVCKKTDEEKIYKYTDARKNTHVVVGVVSEVPDENKTSFEAGKAITVLLSGYIVMGKVGADTLSSKTYLRLADMKLTSTFNATTAPRVYGISAVSNVPNKTDEVICYVSNSISIG